MTQAVRQAIRQMDWNADRFLRRFGEISAIGAIPGGGVNRPFGSPEERSVRDYLLRVLREEMELAVTVDPVGNIWGALDGSLPHAACIALGSHHDSVPNGGRFDGPLGVLMAMEVIETLRENGFAPRHPLTVVTFTAEEPNPFDLSTLGSRTVAGRLTTARLQAAVDWTGQPLAKALASVGGDAARAGEARRTADDIAAFLELHIEQGRRLETAGLPLGVVTGICGIYREALTICGEANHAGTTRMTDRRDALLAGAEIALALERAARGAGEDVVATVGRFSISPGAANIIPGVCECIVEIRGGSAPQIASVRDAFAEAVSRVESGRGVEIARSVLLDQAAQPLDDLLMDTLARSADALGIPHTRLSSMAGHDATHIASFTRAGMLFVPSVDGKSHCPEEESRIEDIACAARTLMATVVALDAAL